MVDGLTQHQVLDAVAAEQDVRLALGEAEGLARGPGPTARRLGRPPDDVLAGRRDPDYVLERELEVLRETVVEGGLRVAVVRVDLSRLRQEFVDCFFGWSIQTKFTTNNQLQIFYSM